MKLGIILYFVFGRSWEYKVAFIRETVEKPKLVCVKVTSRI